MNLRRSLKRWTAYVVGFLLVVALIGYASDYVLFRYRLARSEAFGQVTVTNYDAVQQKSGKTQFIFDLPQPVTCVNTLFAHQGLTPCWYLRQHTEQRTNI
jgi:hypothetical protein